VRRAISSCRDHGQPESKRFRDLSSRREGGIPFGGKSFVDRLAAEARLARQFANPDCARNVAERASDQGRISILQHSLEVRGAILRRFEIVLHIERRGFDHLDSHYELKILRHFSGPRDVATLRRFIATAQKNHDYLASNCQIDPIPWSKVEPHFADAFSDGPDIAEIAQTRTLNASANPRAGAAIFQSEEPIGEGGRFFDFVHVHLNTQSRQAVN
jgi:hypothetical protein